MPHDLRVPAKVFPIVLMLMEVALLFLVSAFTSATLPAFLTQFEGYRYPSALHNSILADRHSLGRVHRLAFALACFALVLSHFTLQDARLRTTGRHRSCHFLFGLCGGLLLYDRHDDVRNYEQHRAMRIPSRRPGRGTGGIPSPHPLVA